MKNSTIKKLFFALAAIIIFNTHTFSQTLSPDGVIRAKEFNELFPKIMEKFDAGKLDITDPDYDKCRRIAKKMSSYDKYTTLKKPGMADKVKFMKYLKYKIKLGNAFLSSNPDGSSRDTTFVAGEPMYLVLRHGKTLISENMQKSDKDGKKYLTISIRRKGSRYIGRAYLNVPKDKQGSNDLITKIVFDVKNPTYDGVNRYLAGLDLGENDMEFTLERYVKSVTADGFLQNIEIPLTLKIKDDRYIKYLDNANKAAYESITLGKAVTSNGSLESKMRALYKKSFPDHNMLRLIITENWYELRDGGRLNYKKVNALAGIKKNDGNCYMVFIPYVHENESTTGGVEWGEFKILASRGPLNFTKMPCGNVDK